MMTKQTRRDFLKSIGVAAITAATGFAMTPVHIEEPEPTEAERRYAEMLASSESDLHWDAMAELDTQMESLAWQMADANRREFEMSIGIHEYDDSEVDPCQVEAETEPPGTYQVDFSTLYSQTGQLSRERIAEAKAEMLSREHLYDAEHYVCGNEQIDWKASGFNPEDVAPTDQPMGWTVLPKFQVDHSPGSFIHMVQDGHKTWGVTEQADVYFSDDCVTWTLQEAGIIGTVESVNEKIGNVVPLKLDRWTHAEGTS